MTYFITHRKDCLIDIPHIFVFPASIVKSGRRKDKCCQ